MIKAVIFDMDGVIIDSEEVYLKWKLDFAREKNPEVQYEELFSMVGATKKDAWLVMERAIHNGQTWEELREDYHGWSSSVEPVDYRRIFRPEVRDVLLQLRQQGYLLAVASSTHLELVLHVMEVNGIREYFDVIVSGDQFQRSKPDPEIYHHTAAKLGVKEQECLVVEDSTIGITAARRAGMTIAALIDDRFGFDRSGADYEIVHIGDVLHTLQEI
ncbi:MAG: HAD family hydrolase [Lachnospiraceae bacterium]